MLAKSLAKSLALSIAKSLAKGDEDGGELLQTLGQEIVAWWRTNEGWDGNIWTDKIAGYEADGTGHAPTTTTLNIDHTVLRFNGTSQYLELGADVASMFESDYTVAIAYRVRSISATEYMMGFSDGTANKEVGFYRTSADLNRVASKHEDAGSSTYGNHYFDSVGGYNNCVIAYSVADSEQYLWANGPSGKQTRLQNKNPTGLNIGAIGSGYTTVPASHGPFDIAEICIFSGVLSDDDAALLMAYFDARYDVWQKIEALPGLGYALDPRRNVNTTAGLAITDIVGGSATWSEATLNPTHSIVGTGLTGCPALAFTLAGTTRLRCVDAGLLSATSGSSTFTEYMALERTAAGGTVQQLTSSDAGFNNWRRLLIQSANVGRCEERVSGTIVGPVNCTVPAAGTSFWMYQDIQAMGASGQRSRVRGDTEETATASTTSASTTHRLGEYAGGGSHPDVEMFAYCIFTTPLSAGDHTLMQAYLDDLMGL